jgi:multidrug efflux pump subunit AcrA (membrane-fusion protein)
MKLPRHTLLGLAVMASLATIACAIYASRSPSQPAMEAKPLQGQTSTPERVAGVGVIEPAGEAIALALPVGGVVSDLRVKPGDRVHAGDLLLTLDSREAEGELALRQTAETSARRALETAAAEQREKAALFEMYRALQGSLALVPEELLRRQSALEQAQAKIATSQAAIDEAKAAAALARTKLSRLSLRAPTDGQVLQVRARRGEWVQPGAAGTVPVTMARQAPLQVRVDIDEADVGRLVDGVDATVVARGQSAVPVQARFVRAEPLLTPKRSLSNASDERVDTRVLQLLFELPATATALRVGQQLDVFIAARAPEAAATPGTPSGTPPAASAGVQ